MTAKFWKGSQLCRVFICRNSLPISTDLADELGSLSRLLSAVSTHSEIIACSGCPADIVRTIDISEFFTRGVQRCFRFEKLFLSCLMHKPSYCVFGYLDIFSVLQALMVSLSDSLCEDCAFRSPELSKVRNVQSMFIG